MGAARAHRLRGQPDNRAGRLILEYHRCHRRSSLKAADVDPIKNCILIPGIIHLAMRTSPAAGLLSSILSIPHIEHQHELMSNNLNYNFRPVPVLRLFGPFLNRLMAALFFFSRTIPTPFFFREIPHRKGRQSPHICVGIILFETLLVSS